MPIVKCAACGRTDLTDRTDYVRCNLCEIDHLRAELESERARTKQIVENAIKILSGGLCGRHADNLPTFNDWVLMVGHRCHLCDIELLNSVREGIDGSMIYPDPNDDTRQWCAEYSVYLRGQAAALLMLDPEIMRKLEGNKE